MMKAFAAFYGLLGCVIVFLHLQEPLYAFSPIIWKTMTDHPSRSMTTPTVGCFTSSNIRRRRHCCSESTCLQMSGDGIATTYTWHEEAFEIEVTVNVPKDTRAKDINFKATPSSIELKLMRPSKDEEILLLDPGRPLRGKISMEGTFWVISDPEDGDNDQNDHRQVTVTIEKQIKTPKDDFEIIEYDWKGVYLQEDEEEVSFRRYDEPEELDVREYAASLGVDIDNINMSMVDKNMFTSGLNMTQSSLDSLKESGLVQEVTQQGDGSEWITNDEGDRIPFNSMGGVMPDHRQQSPAEKSSASSSSQPTIPFLDTNSPWHTAIPVDKKDDYLEYNATTAISDHPDSETKQEMERKERSKELEKQREQQAVDPITALTVSRLKEILKARGLKVSGNKKELQDRLRNEVSSMLMNQPGDDTIAGASPSEGGEL